MPIVNSIDLGSHLTWQASQSTRVGAVWGEEVQTAVIEGGQTSIWTRSGLVRHRQETWWVSVNPPDSNKVLQLVRQLQEISNNSLMSPVYIQWASGGGITIADPEDGWYVLESITPNEDIAVDGVIPVQIVASYIAPGLASKALAVSYIGGSTITGWGGPSQNWLAYPINAGGAPALQRRWSAEGYIPTSYKLPLSSLTPQIFNPTTNPLSIFTGKVTVWDTINTSSFPVPTNGSAISSGWVQVFHTDHRFSGDLVISNDLILILCQVGQQGVQLYFWNILTSQWLNFGRLDGFDNGSIFQVLRSIVLGRVSYEESSVSLSFSTSQNNWIRIVFRVIAGSYFVRTQLVELSQSNIINQALQITPTPTNPKLTWSDIVLKDNSIAPEQNTQIGLSGTGFGFAAALANSALLPCVFGWLYQTSNNLNSQGFAGANGIGLGDISAPAINQSRFYAFFISPFPSVQNLQAEAESGTFSGGFVSVVDATASNGNAAKAPSGTGSNAQDKFGVAWVPHSGLYDVWYRVRVTSSSGSTPEMTLGILDLTTAQFVAGSSTTFPAGSFATSYLWKKANSTSPVFMPVGHQVQFLANTAATLGTDWFIDEAALVPIDMIPSMNSLSGPHNLFSAFAFDRQTKVIPI